MKYFAYGSNMLEERLHSSDRVPSAIFQTIGRVSGYRLLFNKKSTDNSGKCNIVKTISAEDIVYGVVFEIPLDQLESLDKAEGVNNGYHHEYRLPVRLNDGTIIEMLAYVADSNAIDDSLNPYDWYYKLVISGAEQHQLPKDYISFLKAIPYRKDPEPNRDTKIEAEKALNEYFDKKCGQK